MDSPSLASQTIKFFIEAVSQALVNVTRHLIGIDFGRLRSRLPTAVGLDVEGAGAAGLGELALGRSISAA